MSFIWPSMLVALLLVPLLAGLYWQLDVTRRRSAPEAGSLVFSGAGRRGQPGIRRHIPPLLFLTGLAVILFSLARPEVQVSLPRVEGTVILAFDVSNSMAADDIEPTRLEAAKEAARQFVQNQPSTVLVGVVAFSNGGLVVQKPTDDRAALLAAVDRFSPQGGTSLGQGIFTSLNAIAGAPIAIEEDSLEQDGETIQISDFPSAVIILLSDGENTSQPDPLTIAQVAAEAGVRIYPIGIGSPAGSVLEIEGYNVLSQLDEGVLEQIAGLTNGAYFRVEDAVELQEVYNNIDLQLKVRGEKMEATSLFAVIGLALFMVAGVVSLSWFGRVP